MCIRDRSEDAFQLAAFERVRRDLNGSMITPSQTLHFDAGGETVELAYSRLSDAVGLDWVIVVAMPRADCMQGVTENVRRTAIIGGVAALLVVGIVLSILSWVSRDLNKLAAAAREVGQGRLDSPLPDHRNDEIGDLANSFPVSYTHLDVYKRQERRIALPAGWWFDLNHGVWVQGGRVLHYAAAADELPLFARDGACLLYTSRCV